MKLLVIGGTHFVGRAMVEDAVERGHDVTVFHRGPAEPEGFPAVEHLHGDRDGGLDPLRGRTLGRGDRHMRLRPARGARLRATPRRRGRDLRVRLDALRLSGRRATRLQRGESRRASRRSPTPRRSRRSRTDRLKVACELEAQDAFPGRCLVVRPGYIVGPHDPSDRFTYWVRRAGVGGRMLAPGPQDQRAAGRRRPRPRRVHARSPGGRDGRGTGTAVAQRGRRHLDAVVEHSRVPRRPPGSAGVYDWPDRLSDTEAERAVAHLVLTEEGISAELISLSKTRPVAATSVLTGALMEEWRQPRGPRELLYHVARHADDVRHVLSGAVLDLVCNAEPDLFDVYDLAIDTIRKMDLSTVDTARLHVVALQRLENNVQPGLDEAVLRALALLFLIDPSEATTAANRWLGAGGRRSNGRKAEMFFARLFGRDGALMTVSLPQFPVGTLEELYRLCRDTIKSEDDQDRPGGGSHTSSDRDKAEDARNGLLNAIINRPGHATYNALSSIRDETDSGEIIQIGHSSWRESVPRKMVISPRHGPPARRSTSSGSCFRQSRMVTISCGSFANF